MIESVETKLQTWVCRTLLPFAAINGYATHLPDSGRFVTTQTTEIMSDPVSLISTPSAYAGTPKEKEKRFSSNVD